MTVTVATEQLTAKERRELLTVTRGRFKVLRQMAKGRAMEIAREEHTRVKRERARDLTKYRKKIEALNAEQAKLDDKATALVTEIRDAGLLYRGRTDGGNGSILDASYLDVSIKFQVESAWRGGSESEVYATIVAELNRQEQAIVEALILGDNLGSDTARKFLENLPTIETFSTASPLQLIDAGRAA